jgi:formiminotetrahydrofolate cyclodeaminase
VTGDAGGAAGEVSTSEALDSWLDRLAEAEGAPGGGAACGVMLGVSAALLRMVALYTTDESRAADAAERLVGLRHTALRAAEADGVRSTELGAALGAPPEAAGRDRSVREAALAAAESSAALGDVAVALVPELELLADIGNPNITADLVVAAHALVAGVAGALVNLRGDARLAAAHSPGQEDAAAQEQLEASVRAMAGARDAASRTAVALSARVDAR